MNVNIISKIRTFAIIALVIAGMIVLPAKNVFSHCNTMDGPVVNAAKEALNTGNVNFVLMWVQKDDEAEITELFEKTLKLHKQGGEVQELADMNFFENFVRIHRAGEGAPYTGLKPAGEVEAPIAAADRALASGSLDEIYKMLNDLVTKGAGEKFNEMISLKNYDKNKPGQGREFVEKYVVFIHYVEGIYKAAEISGCPHHSKACEGQKPIAESGCKKHEMKGAPEQGKDAMTCNSQEGAGCTMHVLHIIAIVSILNLIALIFVIFKIRKVK